MDISTYVESLQKSLNTTAAPAGKEVADAAILLSHALEPATRLCLLEAMADAADEITATLNDVTVEARLHGRELEFVVNEIRHPDAVQIPADSTKVDSSDDVARISLRLPESIKESVEQAAKTENISVNGWLVRAIATAVSDGPDRGYKPHRGGRRRSFTGFARS